MKNPKIIVLTVLMLVAVALVTVSAFAFYYNGIGNTGSYQPNADSSGGYGYYTNGMMGSGMMGNWMGGNSGTYSAQNPATTQNAIFPVLGFGALIGAVFAGTGGIAYFLASPKPRTPAPVTESRTENPPQNAATPYASVSKTLTAEERQVLDVLFSHDGKYLQKYIRTETGLSRLKTHRIVARLAERGIVTLEKSGNTNEISLSSWLQSPHGLEQNRGKSVETISISI